MENNAIACALNNCTNRERQFAAEYIKLNQAEKERRNRDAELGIILFRNGTQDFVKRTRRQYMKKCLFHTWDYDAIPWYMLDDELYTIEEVVYDDCDPALDGSTEYFVYLK